MYRSLSMLTVLLAGCASGPEGVPFGGAPQSELGIPASANVGPDVVVEAKFVDHESRLDVDLLGEDMILPISVTIRNLRAADGQTFMSPDLDTLRLHLPDGKVCDGLTAEQVVRSVPGYESEIREAALREEEIGDGDAEEGLAFFRMGTESSLAMEGDWIRSTRDGVLRTFHITDCVVAFRLSDPSGVGQNIYVGIAE